MKNNHRGRSAVRGRGLKKTMLLLLCTVMLFSGAVPAHALDLSSLSGLAGLSGDLSSLSGETDSIAGLLSLLGMVSTSLKDAQISEIADQKYTGKAVTPSPVVKLNGKRLKKNTDYTVKYSNNIKVGTAKLTVTGKGSYTGSKSISFKIVKSGSSTSSQTASKKKTFTVKLTQTSFVYNGKTRRPSVKVSAGSKSVTAAGYTVTYKNNKNVGTATVTVTGKGDYKGYKGTAAFKITLKKIALQSAKAVDSKNIRVTWKSDSQAGGYEVQYCTNSSFSGTAPKITVSSKTKQTITLTGLKAEKKYYIRIRSFKKVGKETWYSTWSAAKNATTKKE